MRSDEGTGRVQELLLLASERVDLVQDSRELLNRRARNETASYKGGYLLTFRIENGGKQIPWPTGPLAVILTHHGALSP